MPLALAFVDYKKHLDFVETKPVIEALKRQDIDSVYTNTLNYIYKRCILYKNVQRLQTLN